jgi:hypothetical protein
MYVIVSQGENASKIITSPFINVGIYFEMMILE